MASRMLFGMGRAGWLPRVLAQASGRTHTPLVATVVVTVGVMMFALWLPLVTLAELTSFAILLVFVLVNLSLIAIKRHQSPPPGIRVYPLWVPYGGLLSALALLAFSTLSKFGFSAQARRPPASPGFDHCIRLAAPVSACLVATFAR